MSDLVMAYLAGVGTVVLLFIAMWWGKACAERRAWKEEAGDR